MFRALSITGFRGFSKLKIPKLDRFNLFLGQNNVGKTALLEAIFLLVGPTTPELTVRISGFRGIDQFRNDPEELWGWLFYNKNLQSTIELEAELSATSKRTLTLNVREPKKVQMKTSRERPKKGKSAATASTLSSASELDLTYREGNQTTHARAFVAETGLTFHRGRQLKFPTSIFVSARAGYSSDNPERYSKLEEVGKHEELLEPLRLLEPRLKRLAILITGSGPVLHGDIGIGKMVPLPYMGEGIGRLLTLLLAVVSSENGVVMIDEIETGLHYSVMQGVWTALAQAARKSNVQVFASTHSWECFKAAHDSFAESEQYNLLAHRVDRTDGTVSATTYDQEMIETALLHGLELR